MATLVHGVPTVSVILCTLNRAEMLERCFEHLAGCGVQFGMPWELVVVDNGSTDTTPQIIAKWTGRLPILGVCEHRRGLSSARNSGLRSVSSPIIAFLDDDCIVQRNWLSAVLAAHADPNCADLIGGRVRLHDKADIPVSLRDFVDAADITDLQGIMGRLIGCNFTARSDVLRSIGGFDERLGAGTPAMSGEDFDIFYRLLRAGRRLSYQPTIEVFHAHGRQSSDRISTLMRGYLMGRGAFYAKHALRADVAIIRNVYWELRALVVSAFGFAKTSAHDTNALSFARSVAALSRGALLRLYRT